MVSFIAVIKNIAATDTKNTLRLEAESEDKDKTFICELPAELNVFNKDERVEIELSHSKPAEGKNLGIELAGRIFNMEKIENALIIQVSFWGLLSTFTLPKNYIDAQLKKNIYLSIKKI